MPVSPKFRFDASTTVIIQSHKFYYLKKYFPNVHNGMRTRAKLPPVLRKFQLAPMFWCSLYFTLDNLFAGIRKLRDLYLLQGLRPDIVDIKPDLQSLIINIGTDEILRDEFNPPSSLEVDIRFTNFEGLDRRSMLGALANHEPSLGIQITYLIDGAISSKFYRFSKHPSVAYTRKFLLENLIELLVNDIHIFQERRINSSAFSVLQDLPQGNTSQGNREILGVKNLVLNYYFPKFLPNRFSHSKESDWKVYLSKDGQEWDELPCPLNRWIADPHLFLFQNNLHLLVEDYDRVGKKGRISEISILNGRTSTPRVIIERLEHLSFPQTFQFSKKLFLSLECYLGGGVPIYQFDEKSNEWRYLYSALNGMNLVDPLIFENDKIWYLLATEKAYFGEDYYSKMLLFWANDPVSNSWSAHPQNPVYFDNTLGRNAGIQIVGQKITRVAQEYVNGIYGRSINFRKVIKISPTVFLESQDFSQMANFPSDLTRIHSFTSVGSVMAIDGKFLLGGG